MSGSDEPAQTEALFVELLGAGESVTALRGVLERRQPDDSVVIAVLRRAVPVRLLEYLGASPPWATRPRVLAAVVQNPKAPRGLALKLLPALYWRDLADLARTPRLDGGVRVRAEGLLKDLTPDLRLGERVTLGRIATRPVLEVLLGDADLRVLQAALENPQLAEQDLLVALRKDAVQRALIEQVASSPRWRESYALRLALVQQQHTPLGVALAQLRSLRKLDLRHLARDPRVAPLVQAAALRVADSPDHREPGF